MFDDSVTAEDYTECNRINKQNGSGFKKGGLLNRSPRFLQYSWEEPRLSTRLHFSPGSRQTMPGGTGNCVPVTGTLEKNQASCSVS
ncbi:hypothetical protein Q8A67_002453 [Cirrhinus molitorella]|uniref:Uncharacterized protein n=1 Tax=Cirrhinus molitorella TaxID=172907 RepID=A0AA88QI26_9TELE|nr:hypothetical protein Q8A67_002453 [Cirrhinus molitorella]